MDHATPPVPALNAGSQPRPTGIVVVARVPIVLTSRADSREARIASCGVALVAARRSAQRPLITIAPPAQAARVPLTT
jgi:hypothetical protein